jgi:hypothetical protein
VDASEYAPYAHLTHSDTYWTCFEPPTQPAHFSAEAFLFLLVFDLIITSPAFLSRYANGHYHQTTLTVVRVFYCVAFKLCLCLTPLTLRLSSHSTCCWVFTLCLPLQCFSWLSSFLCKRSRRRTSFLNSQAVIPSIVKTDQAKKDSSIMSIWQMWSWILYSSYQYPIVSAKHIFGSWITHTGGVTLIYEAQKEHIALMPLVCHSISAHCLFFISPLHFYSLLSSM